MTPSADNSGPNISTKCYRRQKPYLPHRTNDETVRCLEAKVGRHANEEKWINTGDMLDWSSPETPTAARSVRFALQLGKLNPLGPPILPHEAESSPAEDNATEIP